MPIAERVRKVEAIVIAHKDYAEADRFVRIFSLEHGKLNTLAKGVRKVHSRKAPHLEPFTHSALVLARGQSFWIITQADTISNFSSIREDLAKTSEAAYILELVDKVTVEGQSEPALFRLTLETLRRVDECSDSFNVVKYFELRFLDMSGFRPELTTCVVCGKEIQAQDQFFSVSMGGILCPQCGTLESGAIPASRDVLRFFRHFQRSTYQQLEKLDIPMKTRTELSRLIGSYISHIMEGQLRSSVFKQQITRH